MALSFRVTGLSVRASALTPQDDEAGGAANVPACATSVAEDPLALTVTTTDPELQLLTAEPGVAAPAPDGDSLPHRLTHQAVCEVEALGVRWDGTGWSRDLAADLSWRVDLHVTYGPGQSLQVCPVGGVRVSFADHVLGRRPGTPTVGGPLVRFEAAAGDERVGRTRAVSFQIGADHIGADHIGADHIGADDAAGSRHIIKLSADGYRREVARLLSGPFLDWLRPLQTRTALVDLLRRRGDSLSWLGLVDEPAMVAACLLARDGQLDAAVRHLRRTLRATSDHLLTERRTVAYRHLERQLTELVERG